MIRFFKAENPVISDAQRLQPLLPGIYDSALDPSRWNSALQSISEALGYDSGSVRWASRDEFGGNPRTVLVTDWGQSLGVFTAKFEQHFIKLFPFRSALIRLAPGEVYSDDQLVPRMDLLRTEYYNDWLRPNGMMVMAGVLVAGTFRHLANLDLQRRTARHPFTDADRRRLQMLAPHIRRAMELNRRVVSLQTRSASLIDAMDSLTVGIALLDREARLLYANAAAEQLLQRQPGSVTTREGRMTVASVELQPRFRALVQSAADTAEGRGFGGGGTLRIATGVAQVPLTLLVTPLNAHSPVSPVGAPQARAVVLMHSSGKARTPVDLLRLAYGLTAAEVRVAAGLANGETLRELAEGLGLSRVTARNQMRAAMDKTGTRRQSELVRLLASHPAVMVISDSRSPTGA